MDTHAGKNYQSKKITFQKGIHFFYQKFIAPKSQSDDARRQERIFNIFIICFVTLYLLAFLSALHNFLSWQEYEGLPLLAFLLLFMLSLILYYLSRSGHQKIAAHIFIAHLFFSNVYASYAWGVELPAGLLFYILIIIIAGILINTKHAFFVTSASVLAISLLGFSQINNHTQPNLYWKTQALVPTDTIMISIILFVISAVSWLSNREIEKSLQRARKSEAELKKERDMLEIRVQEKTREAQKAHLEKMTELSRFAEFGRLSSGVFHDLVNPLTALSLNIEMAKKSQRANKNFEDAEEDLNRAIKASKRMNKLITSVKKQIANHEHKELFSLNHEIEEVIQILGYRARKNNVQINFDTKQTIKTFGNSIKFNQVVTNLIANAIDASQNKDDNAQSQINVQLKQKNEKIGLTISDQGQGISKEIQSKIFEPFFTTKKFEHGTGIGLSLSRRIVEKDFQGKIDLKSKKNKGTTFVIKIPQKTS